MNNVKQIKTKQSQKVIQGKNFYKNEEKVNKLKTQKSPKPKVTLLTRKPRTTSTSATDKFNIKLQNPIEFPPLEQFQNKKFVDKRFENLKKVDNIGANCKSTPNLNDMSGDENILMFKKLLTKNQTSNSTNNLSVKKERPKLLLQRPKTPDVGKSGRVTNNYQRSKHHSSSPSEVQIGNQFEVNLINLKSKSEKEHLFLEVENKSNNSNLVLTENEENCDDKDKIASFSDDDKIHENVSFDSQISDDSSSISKEDQYTSEINNVGLLHKINSQVEHYLSDEYLSTDKYLLRQLRSKSEGYLSVKLLTSFKKIKKLTRNWRVTSEALKYSTNLILSSDGCRVKRKFDLPENLRRCRTMTSVLCIRVPDSWANLEVISELFSPFGNITLARILKPGKNIPTDLRNYATQIPDMGHTSCAVVEFSNCDSAHQSCRVLRERNLQGMRIALLGPRIRRTLYKPEKKKGMTLHNIGGYSLAIPNFVDKKIDNVDNNYKNRQQGNRNFRDVGHKNFGQIGNLQNSENISQKRHQQVEINQYQQNNIENREANFLNNLKLWLRNVNLSNLPNGLIEQLFSHPQMLSFLGNVSQKEQQNFDPNFNRNEFYQNFENSFNYQQQFNQKTPQQYQPPQLSTQNLRQQLGNNLNNQSFNQNMFDSNLLNKFQNKVALQRLNFVDQKPDMEYNNQHIADTLNMVNKNTNVGNFMYKDNFDGNCGIPQQPQNNQNFNHHFTNQSHINNNLSKPTNLQSPKTNSGMENFENFGQYVNKQQYSQFENFQNFQNQDYYNFTTPLQEKPQDYPDRVPFQKSRSGSSTFNFGNFGIKDYDSCHEQENSEYNCIDFLKNLVDNINDENKNVIDKLRSISKDPSEAFWSIDKLRDQSNCDSPQTQKSIFDNVKSLWSYPDSSQTTPKSCSKTAAETEQLNFSGMKSIWATDQSRTFEEYDGLSKTIW